MEHKEEKGKLGRTMMQVLELLQLAERHMSGQKKMTEQNQAHRLSGY